MSKPHCGECTFFSHESIDGYGWCDVTDREQQCSDQCTLRYKIMTSKQAEKVLHHYQKYRRGGKNPMPHPYVIGQAFAGGQVELENTTCMLENHLEVQDILKDTYPLVVPELYRQYGINASYGWNGGSCPNEHQRKFLAETYYIYREILHQLTIRNNKDDWSVYNGSTLRCADSGEPIIIEEL